MDPITAIGLASSIVQFVDFAAKIVSKGNKFYQSGRGKLEEQYDLELVTKDLIMHQASIEVPSSRMLTGRKDIDEDEVLLLDLSKAAVEISRTILERLSRLKASGRHSRWKSYRQALKVAGSKQELDDLSSRLQSIRSQLHLRLSSSLRSANLVDYSTMEDIDWERKANITSTFEERAKRYYGKVFDKRHDIKHQGNISKGPAMACRAILKSFAFPTMHNRHKTIVDAYAQTFNWLFENNNLDSEPWHSFTDWLTGDNQMYWIYGKPASGKSTLMKYLIQHPTADRLLQQWAESSTLIRANFFFYGLGEGLQKTEAGFLCSLLYQILQNTRLIELVLPELLHQASGEWDKFLEALPPSWYSWPVVELRSLLLQVLDKAHSDWRFCFFMDGVDELDGDHVELVKLLHNILQRPNTKVCFASRPLPVFDHVLSSHPRLRLQDLTRGDMLHYVSSKLRDHFAFSQLVHKDSQGASGLIHDVVEKSSGVFLWVTLVVKSLLEGLTNLDTLDDLRSRLRDLPAELEGLFRSMLESIRPELYLKQGIQLMQMLRAADHPIRVFELLFSNQQDQIVEELLKSLENFNAGIWPRLIALQARIRSRTAGLLEVNGPELARLSPEKAESEHRKVYEALYWATKCTVQYLHLTFRDFLFKSEVWQDLSRHFDPGREPSTVLLRGAVLAFQVLKKLPTSFKIYDYDLVSIYEKGDLGVAQQSSSFATYAQQAGMPDGVSDYQFDMARETSNSGSADLTYRVMRYARQAESATGRAQLELLDVFETLSEVPYSPIFPSPLNHWPKKAWFKGLSGFKWRGDEPHLRPSLVTCAIFHGLKVAMARSPAFWTFMRKEAFRALALELAVAGCPEDLSARVSMVAFLLEAGSNPNEKYGPKTFWHIFLSHVVGEYIRLRRRMDQTWLDLATLFVMHGADLELTVHAEILGRESHVSARLLTSTIFSEFPMTSCDKLDRAIMLSESSHRPQNPRDHSPGWRKQRKGNHAPRPQPPVFHSNASRHSTRQDLFPNEATPYSRSHAVSTHQQSHHRKEPNPYRINKRSPRSTRSNERY